MHKQVDFAHVPVLYEETLSGLNINPDGLYVDGTLGGGGHSQGICERLSKRGTLIGIDRDKEALAAAQARLEKFANKKLYINDNHSNILDVLKENDIDKIDGAILDLGVSSYQLDNPERGFSYMQDAPLDMRMNDADGLTAYDVINDYSERDLAEIIKSYGEERWAVRIAKFIVEERRKNPIETTGELTTIIKAAIPKSARRDGPHPAKRTFQAIRIEVNDELGGLERAVHDFIEALKPGGRLCIITFHSLEDRIVKDIFAKSEDPCECPKEFPKCVCGKLPYGKRITRKPILPTDDEVLTNPRSRSAKLRILEKR